MRDAGEIPVRAGPRETPTQAPAENKRMFSIRGFEGLGPGLESGEQLPAALSHRGWGRCTTGKRRASVE